MANLIMIIMIVKYGKFTHLLQLIMIDNVLISRARLCECVQLIHVIHVTPQRRQVGLLCGEYRVGEISKEI